MSDTQRNPIFEMGMEQRINFFKNKLEELIPTAQRADRGTTKSGYKSLRSDFRKLGDDLKKLAKIMRNAETEFNK